MEHGLVEERSDVVVVKGVDNLAAGALADDEPELAQHAQLVGDRGGPRHLARRWGVRGVRARPACAVCGASQAATVLAGDGALCKRVAMKRIARAKASTIGIAVISETRSPRACTTGSTEPMRAETPPATGVPSLSVTPRRGASRDPASSLGARCDDVDFGPQVVAYGPALAEVLLALTIRCSSTATVLVGWLRLSDHAVAVRPSTTLAACKMASSATRGFWFSVVDGPWPSCCRARLGGAAGWIAERYSRVRAAVSVSLCLV